MTDTPTPSTTKLLHLEVSRPNADVASYMIEEGLAITLEDGVLTVRDGETEVLTVQEVARYRVGERPGAEVVLRPSTADELAAKGKSVGKP